MSTTRESSDIRVKRCTVRIHRRGGWSWGDPKAYVDPVVAAIEDALRRAAIEAALPDEADVTLDGSVTLEVTPDGRVTPASLRALVDRLRAAAAEAPAAIPEPARGRLPETGHAAVAHADAGAAPVEPTMALDALAAMLARWSRSGRLAVLARSWSAPALDAWVTALVAATEAAVGPTVGLPPGPVEAIAAAVLGCPPAEPGGPDQRARFLVLAGAVAAALGDRPPDRATLARVARHAGFPTDHPATQGAHPPVASAGPATTPEAGTDRRPAPAPTGPAIVPALALVARHAGFPTDHPATQGAHPPVASAGPATTSEAGTDRRPAPAPTGPAVVPALPFLVLVQLHRLGFLEPAIAALLAAGVTPAAASFAAAAAGKVLDPPGRGWRRRPEERLAVELVSGLTSEQVDASASHWADQSEALLTPLRTALAELYADGRGRHDEVVLTRAGDDVVYGEALGLLPIIWTGSADQAAVVLAQLGDPPVRESDVLAPLVAALGPRRGLPGRDVPELERLLGSVVGTALGSLAQELWGEVADAVLALERMRDLEAQVTLRDRVTVGVPRGQRWLDLSRAGLLDAWPVPWAPGGLWELVTW